LRRQCPANLSGFQDDRDSSIVITIR